MNSSDFNAQEEIELIKANVKTVEYKLDEILVRLPEREKAILDAIEVGKERDLRTDEIIKTQEAAIAKLEVLNCEKSAVLTGMGKWVVLLVLGILSLSVRYTLDYEPGRGTVVKPDPEAGLLLPGVYTLAIIAIATGQDSKVGTLIDKVGEKLG